MFLNIKKHVLKDYSFSTPRKTIFQFNTVTLTLVIITNMCFDEVD